MPDFPRLAQAIRERASALGWKQRDLIQHTHISRGTVQTLWRGVEVPLPNSATKNALEDALGWERGSVDEVLAGGEPRIRVPSRERQSSSSRMDGTRLPLRVQLEMAKGQLLDYDILEFDVAGKPFSFVAFAQTGAYDTEEAQEALTEQLETFRRMIERARMEGQSVNEDEPGTRGDH